MKRFVPGLMLTLLVTSMLALMFSAQPVRGEWIGTVYIRADGSIDPSTAPIFTIDKITYTLTDNINGSIVVERDNIVIDGMSYTIEGTGSGIGIDLSGRSNVTIKNANIKSFHWGFYLDLSLGNNISGNSITNNDYAAIYLTSSSHNTFFGNKITRNDVGVLLSSSSSNIFSRNSIINNPIGFDFSRAVGNTLSQNNVTDSNCGIHLSEGSCYNMIFENNIANNDCAIEIMGLSGELQLNTFYHNNFVNNAAQTYINQCFVEIWDKGYPSGGNYWSDYAGNDTYTGPYQNETGSDGIGDTPYIISEYYNFKDNYPLINMWVFSDFSISASPASLKIQQGSSGSSTITITSINGFNQPVQLTVSGLPYWLTPYITTALNPEQLTTVPNGVVTSTLTVSVSGGAMPGNYTLTVTGTSGTLTHSTYISLEITHAPSPPNTPPVGSFTYSPGSPVHSGDFVSFDASNSYDPDGTIVSYRWNFGDGATSEGKIVSHRFRGAQNEPKTYTVTLTVEDNDGAANTETTSVTVEPLTKLVDVSSGYFGVSCWMKTTYNWVGTDEATGENLYIISKIETYSGGISGTYQLFILRRTNPPPSTPKLVWYIPLPTAPILRTYVTPFTPSVWQQLWGQPAEITTLTFQEGTFQGIGVTDTSPMLIVATGTETGILLYYDIGVTHFEPGSPITYLKPEELKELWEFKDILDLLNKIIAVIGSPCELRIYDSEGRVTGLVNGEVKEEIPGSAYTNGTIMLLYSNATYRYEVVGMHSGTYRLLTISVENVIAITFNATDIPTSTGAKHQYTIDWATISQGKQGVIIQVDSNGDGIFERTFASDSELSQDEFVLGAIKFYAVWEDASYPVFISSNSTVSNFTFNQPQKQISFNLTGLSGTKGYCNVTIPKSLLKGEPWTILVNNMNTSIIQDENATHSFLYFTYTHGSTLQVIIQGTWVIPEFASIMILPLLMLTTLITTILLKRKRKERPHLP